MTDQKLNRQIPSRSKSRKFPKHYVVGLIVMLFGLLVSIELSKMLGLLLIIVGFIFGILDLILRRKALPGSPVTMTTERVEHHDPIEREEESAHPSVLIRCKHCGTQFEDRNIKCPNCGAGHD